MSFRCANSENNAMNTRISRTRASDTLLYSTENLIQAFERIAEDLCLLF